MVPYLCSLECTVCKVPRPLFSGGFAQWKYQEQIRQGRGGWGWGIYSLISSLLFLAPPHVDYSVCSSSYEENSHQVAPWCIETPISSSWSFRTTGRSGFKDASLETTPRWLLHILPTPCDSAWASFIFALDPDQNRTLKTNLKPKQ